MFSPAIHCRDTGLFYRGLLSPALKCRAKHITVRRFQAFARLQNGKNGGKKPFAPLQKGFYDGFWLSHRCKMPKKALESILHRCKRLLRRFSGFRKAAKWQKGLRMHFAPLQKAFTTVFRFRQAWVKTLGRGDDILNPGNELPGYA